MNRRSPLDAIMIGKKRTITFIAKKDDDGTATTNTIDEEAEMKKKKVLLKIKVDGTVEKEMKIFADNIDNYSRSNEKSDAMVVDVVKSSYKRSSKENVGTSRKCNDDDSTLLQNWIDHDDKSFHYHLFSPQEIDEVRTKLLYWYRENRRKLPWRGDPPPWDGSTAGIGSTSASSSNNGNDNTINMKQQKLIFGEQKNNMPTISSSSTLILKGRQEMATEERKKIKEKSQSNNGGDFDYNDLIDKPIEFTAYGVWVSEIMLQQTRVEAVIPYWIKWMKSFPTVYHLASATEDEVNAHWAGLGYYRRAKFLRKGAQKIVEKYDGKLPSTVDELMKIDGIGKYTASAISSIYFNEPVPVVDGNVCRVLSRLCAIANDIKSNAFKDRYAWDLAHHIFIDEKSKTKSNKKYPAGEINQAVMELGATYCAPSGSGIHPNDPLKGYYRSTKIGEQYFYQKENEIISKNNAKKTKTKSCVCEICDPDGISIVTNDLSNRIFERQNTIIGGKKMGKNSREDDIVFAKLSGHVVFPTSPPKKTKQEEILTVAVISASIFPSKNKNAFEKKQTKGMRNRNDNDCVAERNDDEQLLWLLVKRPSKGLLEGQWEFPNICIWNSNSDSNKKTKGKTIKKKKGKDGNGPVSDGIPVIESSVRHQALYEFLENDIFSFTSENERVKNSLSVGLDSLSSSLFCKNSTIAAFKKEIREANKNINDKEMWIESNQIQPISQFGPITHVFSHIRHTMYIEHLHFDNYDTTLNKSTSSSSVLMEWIAKNNNREVKWMSEKDMEEKYGVTSGVKKIIKKVRTEQSFKKTINGCFIKTNKNMKTTGKSKKNGTANCDKNSKEQQKSMKNFFVT